MRALVFKDFGSVELADVPKPSIEEPGDALVRVTTTAICGSDLHVLNGRIPGMSPGSTLGHEFVGVVEEVSPDVTRFKPGDRVLASFTIPCGRCWFCKRRLFSRCPDQRVFGYGAFLGDVQGAQAEYVRVPNADLSLHAVDPSLSDEQVLFAGDIFTTAYDCALEGRIEKGDAVAVVGLGPVGLMAIQVAKTFGPSVIYGVDTVSQRLEMAQTFGAEPIDAHAVHPHSYICDQTDGRGADVVLECVGVIPALTDSLDIVRAGGHVSVIGVHSDPIMELPLNITFVKAVDLKFCGTANIVGRWDDALQLITAGGARPDEIISHRMKLDDAVRGYELFEKREALKVVLTP
ncbi:MAG: alcohol dehydrogenase catalytic domain-containing protein [Candidatus Dormibacteraeota bacterium]|nr:alcohol dehydrogenase catalytic domain-containing protein [Candidatus Dormibacteraeota bacterium]